MEMTIQEADVLLPAGVVPIYFLFDVHYYLAGWVPQHEGHVALVGGVFHPVAGTYALPLGEGEVVVHRKNGQGWVTMWTRSAGFSYDHPLVAVHNTDTRFDYGWYSHVKAEIPTAHLRIEAVDVPHLGFELTGEMTGKSVQATWILKKLSVLESIARQVMVIPVHKERFRVKAADIWKLTEVYAKKATEDVLYRVHDFSKGDVVVKRVFSLGYGVGRFRI